MFNDNIDKEISKTIIEHLNKTLGISMVNVIDFHLRRTNTSLEKICEEPDKVMYVLHELFKNGSAIIEKEIIYVISQHLDSDLYNAVLNKLKIQRINERYENH